MIARPSPTRARRIAVAVAPLMLVPAFALSAALVLPTLDGPGTTPAALDQDGDVGIIGTASPLAASPAFGAAGDPVWTSYQPGGGVGNNAAEPGIAVNWNTGRVFINSFARVLRATFDDSTMPPSATWTDVTGPAGVGQTNVDPVLAGDPVTGRVWWGGLAGACSALRYTDDDGATWIPMTNACGLPGWDHPTIGGGPFAAPIPPGVAYPHAVYYCAQLGLQPGPAGCSISLDGGLTFAPVNNPWITACDGLHGHIRVAPDGTAYLANKSCLGRAGFSVTQTNGAVWRVVGNIQSPGNGRFDPSIAPSYNADASGSYWAYLGAAEADGAFVGVTKDRGITFESVGTGNGAASTTKWFNVGALASPPVLRAEFAEVIAGDWDRAAFAFLGSTSSSANQGSCTGAGQDHAWYLYIAMTYDAGATWSVQRASPDPVQRGPIGSGGACRNLLDFNDIVVDEEGRVLVGYADGCTVPDCIASTGTPATSRSDKATITRQTTGIGLFAVFDADFGPALSTPASVRPAGPGVPGLAAWE